MNKEYFDSAQYKRLTITPLPLNPLKGDLGFAIDNLQLANFFSQLTTHN